jgi:large subunit ribosomal protein L11
MSAVKGVTRLLVPAGVAKPSPKIGQALGPLGVNMMEFCKKFNDETNKYVPAANLRVKLTAFEDRSYNFEVLPPSTSWFLKRVTGVKKGSPMPGKQFVGEVSLKALYEIAKAKQSMDGNLAIQPLEGVVKSLMGSAHSMGLKVVR